MKFHLKTKIKIFLNLQMTSGHSIALPDALNLVFTGTEHVLSHDICERNSMPNDNYNLNGNATFVYAINVALAVLPECTALGIGNENCQGEVLGMDHVHFRLKFLDWWIFKGVKGIFHIHNVAFRKFLMEFG